MDAVERAEQRRIARELGIEPSNLSLMPSREELAKIETPSRRHIKSAQLQALLYPESDLED